MTTVADVYMQVRPDVKRFGVELRQQGERAARGAGDDTGRDFGLKFTARVAAMLPGGLSAAVTAGGPHVAAAAAGVAAAAAAVVAPAIGAAVSAGVLLGVGGGVLAIGVIKAMKDPKVAGAWKTFGDQGNKVMAGFAAPFREPLIRAAATFGAALTRMSPTIKSLGATLAPVIDRLAPALVGMIERALPGLQKAVEASVPLFNVLAEHAPKIGDAVSSFFGSVAKGGPGAAKLLGDVLSLAEGSLRTLGLVLRGLSTAYGFVHDMVAKFIHWLTGTVIPSIRRAIDQGALVFNLFKGRLLAAWAFIRDKVFSPLRTFITQTIPRAFSRGTEAIGRIWDGLKALARRPVDFVVNTIINRGIIDTFNRVSGFFGGPKLRHISFGGGGDGSGRRPQIQRRAGGHIFADGYGMGDGPGLAGMLRSPARWVADRVGLGRLAQKFGNHPFVKMLTGVGGKAKDLLIGKVKGMVAELFARGGGSVGAGGLRSGILAVLGSLRSTFGAVRLISGLRPGARTLSGNVSYHASGRAIDIPPVYAWAAYLNRVFGGRLRELITPWNELNILNGRAHRYTGAVWNQHNFAGGNAHIHAAMYNGGVIGEPVFGVGRSGRTYSFGERGPETVVPGRLGGGDVVHVHLHNSVITSRQAAVDLLIRALDDARAQRRLPAYVR